MPKLVIVSGPQSSGKTTLMNHIKANHKDWFFVDEINPAFITGNKDHGAFHTGPELEKKIIEKSLNIINNLDMKKNVTFLETGIFAIVFARYLMDEKTADEFYRQFLKAFEGLELYVIFINTVPQVSWERRKEKYLKRIKNNGEVDKDLIDKHLNRYKKIITELYPLMLKFYDELPFPKTMIENSNKEKSTFLKEAEKIIFSLLSRKSP